MNIQCKTLEWEWESRCLSLCELSWSKNKETINLKLFIYIFLVRLYIWKYPVKVENVNRIVYKMLCFATVEWILLKSMFELLSNVIEAWEDVVIRKIHKTNT